MHEIAPLIGDLAVMLGLAAFVILFFQLIKQPVVLGYLVAGMILGPHTPPHSFISDPASIKILSELGVIFLMFSLGLEFSFQKLTRVGFSASVIGTMEVVLMLGIGYFMGLKLGWSFYDSLFLGAALSISSTTIIIKAIEGLGLKTKRFAELIFGVLIVEDLVAILLLVVLSTMVVMHTVVFTYIAYSTLKLLLVVGSWFLIGYFLVPTIFRHIANFLNQETLTILSVALCLFLVCVAASLNYSTALGAFIMGSILAETYAIHRIETLIRPIRDIFAAVFFITVGMIIDPWVIIEHWQIVLLLSLLTIVGKIVTTTLGAFLTGQSLTTSLRTGFSMAQIGEFSFIIIGLGLSLGVLSNKIYPIIVAVSTVTTFTTPYLIRLSGYLAEYLDKQMPMRMKYFLTSYSALVYRTISTSSKTKELRATGFRLFINGVIVALIFTTVHYFAFHYLSWFDATSDLHKGIFLVVSLIVSLPFVWGMLFSYKIVKPVKTKKIKKTRKKKIYLTSKILVIWLITLIEISILSIIYFQTWFTISVYIIVLSMFFFLTYQYLERSYRWFEHQLVRNVKAMDIVEKKFKELAPWDTHLVEIEVAEHSPFVGKELKDCLIRDNFGVNVVAISHGQRVIAAPRGNEKIYAHDRLIVLGNDSQIDAFRKEIEVVSAKLEPMSMLNNFALKAIFLEAQHPLVGKTIRNSKIRETLNGLVVGLERHNVRTLNPHPDMILQAGDMLLIVGEITKIKVLSKG